MLELLNGLTSIKETLNVQDTVYLSVIVDIIVVTTVIYCIASILLFAMRLLKVVKLVYSTSEKIIMSTYLGIYFLMILFIVWISPQFIKLSQVGTLSQWIYVFLHEAKTFIAILLLFAMIAGIGFVFIKYTIWLIKTLKNFLREEWKVNGKLMGTIVGIYDAVSGFYWGILVFMAFAFQLALIILPFLFVLIGLKAGQDD